MQPLCFSTGLSDHGNYAYYTIKVLHNNNNNDSVLSFSKVRVLYGGNELFDYEVESTFWSDVRMAIFAVVSIAVLMFLMTSCTLSLTLMGLWSIVLSFPFAIFFYRVVFNIVGLGIMNGAAAFVIIGIGELRRGGGGGGSEGFLSLVNPVFSSSSWKVFLSSWRHGGESHSQLGTRID